MNLRLMLSGVLAAAAIGAIASPAASIPAPAVDETAHHADRLSPRARVTATSLTPPIGRIRVAVRSNSSRVRLTYRTAAGRLRSTTIRVRRGRGATTLARGSRSLTARALATARRRGSKPVRVRANPRLADADGNGTLDWQYDLNTDGRYEVVLFDDDRNSRFEQILLLGPRITGIYRDQDQDGYYEVAALDADNNGRLERMFYDGNRDGYPEFQCLDLIGSDGVAESWVDTRTPSGNPPQDRVSEDLITKEIVTLNQLRQLDPWSLAYLPYNPAPWILRFP